MHHMQAGALAARVTLCPPPARPPSPPPPPSFLPRRLSLADALCGTVVQLQTLDGRPLSIPIQVGGGRGGVVGRVAPVFGRTLQ